MPNTCWCNCQIYEDAMANVCYCILHIHSVQKLEAPLRPPSILWKFAYPAGLLWMHISWHSQAAKRIHIAFCLSNTAVAGACFHIFFFLGCRIFLIVLLFLHVANLYIHRKAWPFWQANEACQTLSVQPSTSSAGNWNSMDSMSTSRKHKPQFLTSDQHMLVA